LPWYRLHMYVTQYMQRLFIPIGWIRIKGRS
jgi:hypothetical protein